MPPAHTVDRLDKPSTYGAPKNNKKRRYNNREGGQPDEQEQLVADPAERLKDATTLYVGNL